ncbi:tuberous sclerosis 1 protein [Podospora fimiseda]|uniref:Tuberous sclerosis 1 protein n=1 Tax=Podospora fimiseda TaxID=252190 RepID=A0AAN7BQV3_9PEZI|nr:tuberous sclerosis 1 protein [Podospora fimiseda]
MTSSGSSKDLLKAISGYIQSPTLPLPAELSAIISSYIDKHEKADESACEKLNDELISIWEKTGQNHPERYAPFLAILRELRPVLRSPARVFGWWDRLLDPLLEHVAREKGLAREVLEHTLDVLIVEDSSRPSTEWSEAGLAPLVRRMVGRWMEVCETPDAALPLNDLKERMIKQALMAFGKRDPKAFMMVLDSFVVKKEHRTSALCLLGDFISSQPPHLHLILQTPLFGNILQSLQKDESTTTITMALSSLMMIMPHIPSSLVQFLPTLFNIYARLLFWDRDSYFSQAHTEPGVEQISGEGYWDKVLLDPDNDGATIPYLANYFTMLYGLYPINFLDYIRKPHRYLRHANYADDIDVEATEIRDRSDRFRKQHLLHPNFYNLTIESEKTDLGRWIKSEAAEVLADCMALHVEPRDSPMDFPAPASIPREDCSVFGESCDDESGDLPLLGGRRNELHQRPTSTESLTFGPLNSRLEIGDLQSGRASPSGYDTSEPKSRGGDDSPTLPPQLAPSASHSRLQDLIHSNKAIRSGLHSTVTNDSVPSLLLSPQEHGADKSQGLVPFAQSSLQQGGSGVDVGDSASLLYHQRLLLLNDLQYERFIKQQHMNHMGELRRKQVRVAATEAETQNLVMANRSLKQRMDDAKRSEAQIKKEFDHRRNMAKKWESDLTTKLQNLREEKKKWGLERNELKQQLEKAHAECERLKRIVDETEKKMVESEQNLVAVDISTATIEKLKAEIARLSASEHAFQGKQLEMETAVQEAASMEAKAQQAFAEVEAMESQFQQERKRYEADIEALKTQVGEAKRSKERQPSGVVTAAYESALAELRTKVADLQKQLSAALKKQADLEAELLNVQAELNELKGKINQTPLLRDSSFESSLSGSPITIRSRSQRGLSDPDGFDGLSHNSTQSLEPASSSLGSVIHRPATPSGAALGDASGAAGKLSPQAERYFGRGGVQNAIKKDKKEEKAEKKDKKDKKPGSGIRGIRGFV